jgi:secreted trypsin-like serine protease
MVLDMRFLPLPLLLVCAALILGISSPASAITNGTPDGDAHPAVGALVGSKAYDDGTWSYCTGTLISPTVFLTAAHCAEKGQKTALVSFASQYRLGDGVYVGRYEADPAYTDRSGLHDIAVVIFNAPIRGIKPARLPTAGLLDRLAANGTLTSSVFTPVGYGSVLPTDNGKKFHYSDTRRRTSISFGRLTPTWLRLSLDAAKKNGGTCFGDSGGPNFLGGPASDLLVATTISGDDDACKSTNLDYRLDTDVARAFLAKYVTLP